MLQKYVQLLEKFMELEAFCKQSLTETGAIDFGASIKGFDDLFRDFVLELRFAVIECTRYVYIYSNRADFFKAKGQFYAMTSKISVQLHDTISLGEYCIQELRSLLLSLPQIDTKAWSQDAVEEVCTLACLHCELALLG